MTLSVVQLFYLLAVFWQNSSQALPVLYPGSSGQNWLQSLISQNTIIAETANSMFSSLQSSRQGMPNMSFVFKKSIFMYETFFTHEPKEFSKE